MDTRLIDAPTGEHFVQIHEEPAALIKAVGAFAERGLTRQQAVVLVGTRTNLESIDALLERAGADPAKVKAARQLITLDAEDTLNRILTNGMPNWTRFQETIGGVLQDSLRGPYSRVRVWGEMVNLLWHRERVSAAIRLEELWNALGRSHPFCLFCTYSMEPLGASANSRGMLRGIVNTHSCVVANDDYSRLESAVETALEEVLGVSQSGMVRTLIKTRADLPLMPRAQALILWLQENMPMVAERIVERGRVLYLRTAQP